MLAFFESITTSLGKILRTFVDTTCAAFKTKELPKEVAARVKRAAAQAAKTGGGPATSGPTSTAIKSKTLNLSTYKLHALGDYVDTIRRFGTTDSYSTQTVRPSCAQYFIATSFRRANWSIVVPSGGSRVRTSIDFQNSSLSRMLENE